MVLLKAGIRHSTVRLQLVLIEMKATKYVQRVSSLLLKQNTHHSHYVCAHNNGLRNMSVNWNYVPIPALIYYQHDFEQLKSNLVSNMWTFPSSVAWSKTELISAKPLEQECCKHIPQLS